MTDEIDRRCYVPEEGGPANAWITTVKADLAGCLERARRMLETTGRMADDMRVIRRCVVGDER